MSLATPKTASATIANGAALSGAVCLGSGVLCAVQMPTAWTAADLTFQISDDGGTTWTELLDSLGNAITIASPSASKRYEVDASDFKSAMYLKVRSGTSALAVNQASARTLTLIARKFYPEA
jgi:hypothetical protein